ncbi:hypothetical protein JI735_01290 [Paenibacillus sonchi]|uniref:Uncharacterized protein n=1 Tax=Paenibacillus sonchi TaxID=373687 RepID=A0A974SCH3_9BACL|nr:hypothetical protein [Paenibacillus sonchi]MCE3202669.1 hypothetical protein [Paenibacillus sonchi]QQZ61453.1 hypothetical protein JI735_01290 [Paenibacillus sonchi]
MQEFICLGGRFTPYLIGKLRFPIVGRAREGEVELVHLNETKKPLKEGIVGKSKLKMNKFPGKRANGAN